VKPASRDPITGNDLRTTALVCRAALTPLVNSDWEQRAGDLEWSCHQTLVHICSALTYYAVNLATGSSEPRYSGLADPSLPVPELLDALEGRAAVLAVVCEAVPPTTRAAQTYGRSDPEGFAAMGCDEMIVHTADIAAGLDVPFDPPPDICARVLARLFPWAPRDEDPWATLRWANGRASLGGRARLEPDWSWHGPPLEEWDGTDPTTRG
jgi:hypothetical protein